MNLEEAKLYLEYTSKDDFNLEEWQKENRYQAIQAVLKEIERLDKSLGDITILFAKERKKTRKAIEYIEQHILATETEDTLLNILKGEDKE